MAGDLMLREASTKNYRLSPNPLISRLTESRMLDQFSLAVHFFFSFFLFFLFSFCFPLKNFIVLASDHGRRAAVESISEHGFYCLKGFPFCKCTFLLCTWVGRPLAAFTSEYAFIMIISPEERKSGKQAASEERSNSSLNSALPSLVSLHSHPVIWSLNLFWGFFTLTLDFLVSGTI